MSTDGRGAVPGALNWITFTWRSLEGSEIFLPWMSAASADCTSAAKASAANGAAMARNTRFMTSLPFELFVEERNGPFESVRGGRPFQIGSEAVIFASERDPF